MYFTVYNKNYSNVKKIILPTGWLIQVTPTSTSRR